MALPLLLVAVLLSAGIEDARTRLIADWKSIVIALAAPLWWATTGWSIWPDAVMQVVLAASVFALFVAAFHFGWMGGGDVKLIGALALWLPLHALTVMLMLMSVIGGMVTAGAMLDARRRRPPGGTAAVEVPYGVAIAIAGMLALNEPLLNQFS